MLEEQVIHLPLGGLEQKKTPLTRTPGALDRALNIEFDKTGSLNKRRGYRFVDLSTSSAVLPIGAPVDTRFLRVTTFRDELIVFGYRRMLSLLSPTGAVRTNDTFVTRGPTNRGALQVEYITAGVATARAGSG